MIMLTTDIKKDLRRLAAERAGYTVMAGGLVGGWGFRFLTDGRLDARWGLKDEEAAWDGAFDHLCGVRDVYLHKKGGIYAGVGVADKAWSDFEASQKVMIYEHLAPRPYGMWVRDLAEFHDEGRFTRVRAPS